MSKHKVGDKFIVNIKEVMESDRGTLYRADFSTLVFDDYGLDALDKYDEIQERLELIDELKQVEYNKGLNDGRNEAWGLARTLYDKKCEEIEKIFDVEGGFWNVIRDFTPQEAIAKLKAYEEAQKIEVGDVVELMGGYGVVTNVDKREEELDVLWSSGNTNIVQFDAPISLKKTGKHIDIKSILEQIGE